MQVDYVLSVAPCITTGRMFFVEYIAFGPNNAQSSIKGLQKRYRIYKRHRIRLALCPLVTLLKIDESLRIIKLRHRCVCAKVTRKFFRNLSHHVGRA